MLRKCLSLTAILTLFLSQDVVSGNCLNADAVPRLVAGEFSGVLFTPKLSFKNLSDKQCDGQFNFFQGDFEPATGMFEFNGQTVRDGVIPLSLAPGQGLFGQLTKVDSGGYQGFGFWQQDGDCVAGQDVALTADVQVGRVQSDGQLQIIDQIGFSTSSAPAERWGFSARRLLLPDSGGTDSTAFSIAPCEAGFYNWTVDFFDESGVGQWTQQGSASGPMAIFVHEVFETELPESFTGYVTVSVDRPSHLEALTVASGPHVQGGLQISNFPVRAGGGTPYAEHAFAQELQQALNLARASNNLRGVSAAIVMPGQPLWTGASGNSTASVPLTSEMFFDIGSITKNFVAALVLQLSEDGLLSLDDPLSNWLPSFPNVDNRATIRQLLNHTSGVHNFTENNPVFWSDVFANPGRVWRAEEILAFTRPAYFPPGDGWHYSNTGYLLLGLIVEQATGSQVSAELRQRLLEPLSLDQTFLPVEESRAGTFAHGWTDIDRDGQYVDASLAPRTALHSSTWTAGALISTAADVATWGWLLFEGEVLDSGSLDQMLTFHPASVPELGIEGYGLGTVRINLGGDVYWGHGGDIPGFNSVLLYSPRDRISLAVLCNEDEANDGMRGVVTALLNVVSY